MMSLIVPSCFLFDLKALLGFYKYSLPQCALIPFFLIRSSVFECGGDGMSSFKNDPILWQHGLESQCVYLSPVLEA